MWRSKLPVGVHLKALDEQPSTLTSFAFYSGFKQDADTGKFGKIRLIVNDKDGNTWSPIAEHITLLSRADIVALTSIAANGAAEVRLSTKELLQRQKWEKERQAKGHTFWDSFRPEKRPETPDLNSFLPVYSKVDLSMAYYQFAVKNPKENTIAIFGEGKWHFFESASLSFSNAHLACGFLQISEFPSRTLAARGIVAVGCVDDFIILSPPGLAEAQHAFAVELFTELGLTISQKADGNIQ